MGRPLCQARAQSREFGSAPCFNYAKTERFGLRVCNVHARMIDRLAGRHGVEYALAIARLEWRRPEAELPLLAKEPSP